MDVYGENILDHYRHPRAKKPISLPSASYEVLNHTCGDSIGVELKIEDGVITEIGWKGYGCAISQAAMSMLSEQLEGEAVEEAEKLSKENVYQLLGVPIGPRRMKCALMGLHALKNALRIAAGKESQSWLETVAVESES